jgi:DNA-binding winged helix-turn-helix (wHTH) protein
MRVRFGEFVFDSDRRELEGAGESIHLSPKGFDLLSLLIERRPNAVRKEELFESIWPDTIVEQANLNNLISEIRAAIGDHDRTTLITRPRFGYAFAIDAQEERGATTSRKTFRLSLGESTYELQPGRNLIGREDDCVVVIDSPEVSRYHAAIDVEPAGAILHDLGSKNGTFVDGRRIESTVSLDSGAEIEIGRRVLRFRTVNRKESTISDPRRNRRQ